MCSLAFVKLALLGPPVPHKLLCSCYSVAVGASPLGGTCGDPYRAGSVCVLLFRDVWRPAALCLVLLARMQGNVCCWFGLIDLVCFPF